jgi:hypothetical protein
VGQGCRTAGAACSPRRCVHSGTLGYCFGVPLSAPAVGGLFGGSGAIVWMHRRRVQQCVFNACVHRVPGGMHTL